MLRAGLYWYCLWKINYSTYSKSQEQNIRKQLSYGYSFQILAVFDMFYPHFYSD